uniref:Uncharacterized protein n=1 Tax=Leersia perrieri TaxID=77586 RepID=A0A0D9V983_9ORYZ
MAVPAYSTHAMRRSDLEETFSLQLLHSRLPTPMHSKVASGYLGVSVLAEIPNICTVKTDLAICLNTRNSPMLMS